MTDFNSIPIPPRGIESIDTGKLDGIQPKQNQPQSGDFQNQLLQALGQISADADQVANAASSNYENVEQAMGIAKNVFADTMQMHQMMQELIHPNANDDSDGDKEAPGDKGANGDKGIG